MLFVLNTPILTEYGVYTFSRISVEEAKELISNGFVSAIGHEGTAVVLSEILGTKIPMSRVAIKMQPGDKAIVFRLLERLPEGKILSTDELKQLKFELGLLERKE
ncbi:hypothetical protein DMB44_04265 [Thermoplasma sp. Kam2015]|uniref:YddF family protein n=1 Tax=Thermoplasma sp. Kam2015 TaxID=2094122 RepID=UPI000D93378B|nr:YddF family protein [Thermoplasma sp. Kam2015]PYB68555.1 hypothetical protein DMB44_04265 [Thermoplasma sp. Kam2015]